MVQFLPFRHAVSPDEKGRNGSPRPSPKVDQRQYGKVRDYLSGQLTRQVVVREPRKDRLGEDGHDVLGEDGYCVLGAPSTGMFAWAGLGYHPDLADKRDRDAMKQNGREKSLLDWLDQAAEKEGKEANGRYNIGDEGKAPLPPVEDQGPLQSCTANAVISIVEYLVRRYTGDVEDFSRMFLYKAARRLLGWSGDSGAYIRTTIKALRLFGVPPETSWPYDAGLLDQEPGAYQYSYAQNYKTLHYARLDTFGLGANDLIKNLKIVLRHNFPVAFGFPVYDNINDLQDWVIPVPTDANNLVGGHAVAAVGYDLHAGAGGSLIIRNSWGLTWGDLGYAYLPFEYIRQGLAMDFWTVYDDEWLDTKPFDSPKK